MPRLAAKAALAAPRDVDGCACGPGTAAQTRRGRRRRAILDAAETLFREKGYGATATKDIIARSGGSLETFYSLFGGKQGLLLTIVTERCARLSEHIRGVPLTGLGLADRLRAIARHALAQLADPGNIALFRVIVSAVPSLPALGSHFYQAGFGTAQALVADCLQQHSQDLAIDDLQVAAALFLQMAVGGHQLQQLCLLAPTDRRVQDRQIDQAVETFMHAYVTGRRRRCAAAAG